MRTGMNRFAKGRVARGQVPASSSSQLEGLEPRQLFAVIPVTSTANTVDPNDGVTTLREAITQANNQTGADVIQLASGATYTLNAVDNTSFGDTGLPLVSSEITVEGNGATVARSGAAGTPAFRLFAVDGGGGQLTLNNLTLTGGLSKGGGGGPGGGGGAGMGGAVYTEGRLRLSGVLVVGNTAKGGFGGVRSDDAGAGGQLGGSGGREGDPAGANGIGEPGAFGGGGGKGTTGKGGDGGFGGGGGATGSSSDANRGLAGFGGGRGNVSNGAGGGGAGLGGGVFANANTSVDIVNSTFANNTAEGGSGHQAGRGLGGAIFVADGFVDLLNNTISNNTADAGRGLYLGPSTGSQFLAYNNIFGQTNNAVPDIASAGDEIRGRNNLVRNATGALMSPDFNQSTADPKLGPLANNGGLTRTFALLNGSLAINSGFTEITQLEGLTVDQRGPGFGRIEGPAVDVGALESTGVFPPSVVTIGNASVAEGNDGIRLMTFTVTRSGDTSSAAAVDYRTFSGSAAAGDDYNDASGTLTFAPGVTTRTFTVQVRGDGVAEQDETFTAMLWRPSGVALGSQLQGVGTIVNDDGPLGATPNISIANASTFEGNSGTKLLTFTLTRSGDVSAASTVGFNTANVSAGEGDYGPTSGTVTFAAGETSKTISVVVKGDTKVENDEVFRVLLSSATNATLANTFADGTIVNDDGANAPPTIAVANASTAEGNSGTKQLLFTVTLNKAWNQTITVDFVTRNQTAGEGDYAPTSGTITFAAGQTSRTIAITIKGDTKVENDETFAIDLSNAVNATIGDALGIGTIRNDD